MSTFPSLRATMGVWRYYVTLMSLEDVARWVQRTDQIHSNEQLRTWIQRKLQERRIEEIADCIIKRPQHFFNAIVVGIFGGDPEWFPLNVGDSPVLGAPGLGDASKAALGLLRLQGNEKVFAIDGQHRVEGIKAAVGRSADCRTELQAVIFVGHSPSPEGRERTRRLFSVLNRQAKPVSKGEIVALDEDDAFAVVTRDLVEKYEPLTEHRVAFSTQTPMPSSNLDAVTTILGLYDLVQAVSEFGRQKPKDLKSFMASRPSDAVLKQIYDEQIMFWDSLQKYVPAIKAAVSSRSRDGVCSKYRYPGGGHLLFRPAGQKAFARAVRVLVDTGDSIEHAVQKLARFPLMLEEPPWVDVLWDSRSNVMITKTASVKLASDILLLFCGSRHVDSGDVRGRYSKVTDGRLLRLPTLTPNARR